MSSGRYIKKSVQLRRLERTREGEREKEKER